MAVQILRTLLGLTLILALACGGAAPATQAPPVQEATQPIPTATPISQPTVTPHR
jgi:hypothetical protein